MARRIILKTGGARPFDPLEFLKTAAAGRVLSLHQNKQTIFVQGDEANAVFYIRKGKIKVTVVSAQGKEAVVAILGRRRMFDRTDEASGDRDGNDRMPNDASGEVRDCSRACGRAGVCCNVCQACVGKERPR